MLTLFEAMVLGLIQGIAEWLPVSSEGLTSLVMVAFFDKTLAQAIPISIWLHIGTLLSAIVFFRKDVSDILSRVPGYVRDLSQKNDPCDPVITFLIVATILTGLVGYPLIILATGLEDISGALAMALIGALLIFTGLLQKISDKRLNEHKEPSFKDSLITGLFQGLAALPGVSRSGITVSTLLLLRFNAPDAIKLSFLMSIPAVLAAEVGIGLMGSIEVDIYSLVALLFSFGSGLLTIDLFLKVAEKVDFSSFCIVLGLLSLTGLLF